MSVPLLDKIRLKILMTRLKAMGGLPKKIELTSIQSAFIANVYDDVSSQLIQESVSTGFAPTSDLALLKALTEHVERGAFISGGKKGLPSCNTVRSDGVAAFPVVPGFRFHAVHRARKNAYCEAVERFVWATWWDNADTQFKITTLTDFVLTNPTIELIAASNKMITFNQLIVIEPSISPFNCSVKVLILLGGVSGGGFICGGAAGFGSDDSILFRAASEFFRHSSAVNRVRKYRSHPSTFYEHRVMHFGSGFGDAAVNNRLSGCGTRAIQLPSLKFDEEIPHEFDDFVVAYRCYFENQPLFVGGPLERLCV